MPDDERTERNRKAWEDIPSAAAMRQGAAWPEHVASLPGQVDIDLVAEEAKGAVVDVHIEPQKIT